MGPKKTGPGPKNLDQDQSFGPEITGTRTGPCPGAGLAPETFSASITVSGANICVLTFIVN